jgi:nitroreductase
MTICPNQAIKVDGLLPEEFSLVKPLIMKDEQLLAFLQQRRSIRRYKSKPVPRELIDRILEGVQCAPTGTGRSTTAVIIIDNPETLAGLSRSIYQVYEELDKNLQNPFTRFFMKHKVGEQRLRTLQDFVMPGMQWYIRWYKDGKSNEILRDCPAMMLFHSPVYEPVGAKNCLIAAFQAILMAEVLGIGTCLNDLIPPACNRAPAIRKLLQLPEDHEVYASITLEYPNYKFEKIPPRKLAEVRYLN